MRRSKLGDLYCIRVPNGYKLLQRAYDVPRKGYFVRVFDGLYSTIPTDLTTIVAGPHSYILNFYVSKAYRVGLAQWLGNYPVPDAYPFPKYMFDFSENPEGKSFRITIVTTDVTDLRTFSVKDLTELPEEYRNLSLLWPVYSVAQILYLFDSNWSPQRIEAFDPIGSDNGFSAREHLYSDMIDRALTENYTHNKST